MREVILVSLCTLGALYVTIASFAQVARWRRQRHRDMILRKHHLWIKKNHDK